MAWLDSKSVVVTGAGRGIGAACALAAAREGARVVVNDLDADVAGETVARIRSEGGTALVHVADVRQWSEAAELIERCVREYGAIDGLVTNAGRFGMSMPAELTQDQLEDLFSVNVGGVVACAMPALRHMRAQGSGSIVNVTSGAHFGLPYMSAYAATKGAVASLTYVWAVETQLTGVRVNAVSPLARTRMGQTTEEFLAAHGLGGIDQAGTPEPAANAPAVVYLLSDAAAAVTGQVLRIEGPDLALVAHPAVLHPVLHAPGTWTVEGVARAFEETLADRLVPVGMGPVVKAEYLAEGSAFWSGELGEEPAPQSS